MKSAFDECPFGELYLQPSANGVTRPSAVRGEGYKMVNMGELYAYPRLKDPPMERVPLSESERTKFALRKGDLLFARQSLVLEGAGKCSVVLECEEDTCFESHLIRVRLDPKKADSQFYYYFFKSGTGTGMMQTIVNQVSAAGIRGSDLAKLKVLRPTPDTQKKIAAVLSAYDELIEVNRRRIGLLEKLAEELYREWFVRLRFPGHEKVKRRKGIPDGWEVTKLGTEVELCYGKALKEDLRVPGDFPVYGSSGIVGTHNEALVKTSGLIVGRKGNVGSVHWSDKGFFPIDTVYYVKSSLPDCFLYFLLQSMNFINNDAAVPGLSRSQAYANLFYLPPRLHIERFAEAVGPQFKARSILTMQNEALTRTRDLLLPRLISGKLRVEDLDIQFPPGMEEMNP